MTRKPSNKQSKILALVSKSSDLKSVFEQLRPRNILVFPVHSLEGALKILETVGAVDYCLLSVDYSQIDIYELPQKIENEFNIPVIAISELRDKQSMWRLTKVKTKNVLYSKATAQNIYSRVELIKKALQSSRERVAQRKTVPKNIEVEAKAKAKKNIYSLGKTEKKSNEVRLLTPPPRKQEVGTVKLTADVKLTLPPVKTKFIEIQAGTVSKKFTPFKQRTALVEGVDVIDSSAAPKTVSETLNELAKTVPPEDTQKIILGCLRDVLSEYCNPNEFTQQTNLFGRSMVISVKSAALTGTFVIATQFDAPKLGLVQNHLYDYLRSFGFDWQQEEIKVELLTNLQLPAEVITSGAYVAGVAKEGEIALSYYTEAVEMPELTLTNSTQHIVDPSNLIKNTRVNFDLFLHLKMNNKDLHYVKVGSLIDQKQIDKLKVKGFTAWVPRNQLSNLNEYVLLQRLLKMINPDVIEDEVEELLKIS